MKNNMLEIERKFLIKDGSWKPAGVGSKLKQGYLSVDPERVVRVRVADEKAFLTIKGRRTGIVRTELEYEIPKQEAEVLLKLCLDYTVEKTRYKKNFDGKIWEIDIFEGLNSGLEIAEIELENEHEEVKLPTWVGEEVSTDSRYFNSWLSKHPYQTW